MFKKKLFILTIAVLATIFLAGAASAGFQDMWAAVYRWKGGYNGDMTPKLEQAKDGIMFQVLRRDTSTPETLYEYGDDAYTALSQTNGVTTTNFADATKMKAAGILSFRVDPSETLDRYVDLIVVDRLGGFTAFVEDFDKFNHTIIIDERPNVEHVGCIWYTFGNASSSEQLTYVDFLSDTHISKVWYQVVTPLAHKPYSSYQASSIHIGLLSSQDQGDADGFVVSGACSTPGMFNAIEPTITTGSCINAYVSTASKVGALIGTSYTGADYSNVGMAYNWGHIVTGSSAFSLTYTLGTSCTTGRGYIYYKFSRIR